MRFRTFVSTAACAALALAAAAGCRATPKVEPAPAQAMAEPSPEEMAKMMAEHAALAPEHAQMADQVGVWDGDVTMWMPQEVKSAGTMTNRSDLGGRVIFGEWRGDFMGRPFQGRAVSGYDKDKKKHWTLWMDTLSTGFERQMGELQGGVLRSAAEPAEMMGMTFTSRQVTRFLDRDHHVMERYTIMNGAPETKDIEIRFTRRGAAPLPPAAWTTASPTK